jgi:YesN/AraC family two-component response regulator
MFLTGLSDFATLTSASALDVQGFLVKPVSANLLHQKIREAFREKSKIKNPEDYGELLLSHSGAASTDASEENNEESQSEAEDQTDYQKVHLRELLSGWVLRQDIYAKGVLLLKNGTVLKPGAIMVLKDLATVLDDQYVVVECATEKS